MSKVIDNIEDIASIDSKVAKVTSTDNAIARYDGTGGAIQNSSVIIDDNNNVGIGTSSPVSNLEVVGSTNSAGIVSVRPNGTGTLGVFSARNSSDTVNYSFGQIAARADKITIDSSKQGTGSYLPLVLGIGGGSGSFMIDTLGNSLHINSTGGLGYGTGAGGTVIQLTSKSTPVTLNKPCGSINVNNSTLVSGQEVTFTVYNNLIATYDNVIISPSHYSEPYSIKVKQQFGQFNISITNTSGITKSDNIMINFTIIKGAYS